MGNRFGKTFLVATVLLLVTVAVASAFDSTASGFTDGTTFNSGSVRMSATGSNGTCTTQTYSGFYQWDLTSISDSTVVKSATITLTKYSTASATTVPTPSTLSIYAASNDNLTSPGPTATGAALASIENIVDPVASTLTFASTPALASYVQQQLTDNKATFVLQWSQCAVGSSESSLQLRLATTADLAIIPTAVSLSTFAAAGPATNWLLIAGLGLAALAAGGVWLYRKQATR